MLSYMMIKHAHMASAMLSVLIFALRGAAVLAGSKLGNHALARRLSMGLDTCLLVFGVWLVVLLGLNPVAVPWLGVKLLLLVVYIVLGVFALKRAASWRGKLLCYIAALTTAVVIFGIARAHHVMGWLKLL
ncbi:invasion activity up-regulator [Ahniella affigens]|uniref:Invasion activity up-regulator n=1 Tax=Ahniella affigens TaxID=2021234 RepID=A0A2P1PTL5_9GAMM|nr:SirB2 family protein [Ahniella affigens]AVP98171.1 invasion activity up-regulator [Ahniella affigens]